MNSLSSEIYIPACAYEELKVWIHKQDKTPFSNPEFNLHLKCYWLNLQFYETHSEEKSHYLFKYIQRVCLKHVKTDSNIVKLLSSSFLDTKAVFTGTCLDMNTVSSGKSICLFLHRRCCKHTEHEMPFKLEYIIWEQKYICYVLLSIILYTDFRVSLLSLTFLNYT